MTGVSRAVEFFGTQVALARFLGYDDLRNISPWVSGKRPFPAEHCVSIEKGTKGAVTRKDLRPNDWQAIWPELAKKNKV